MSVYSVSLLFICCYVVSTMNRKKFGIITLWHPYQAVTLPKPPQVFIYLCLNIPGKNTDKVDDNR